MGFWRKFKSSAVSTEELKKVEMVEAYTCWLKNEKLSRKQKRILKEIHSFADLQALKQLIDFTHYRFEEGEHVEPRLGVQLAKTRLFAAIRGETSQSDSEASQILHPQPGYSPQAMGNVDTDVLPVASDAPNVDTDVLPVASDAPIEDAQQPWDVEKPAASSEKLQRYNAIRTLSRFHVRFELKDDDVYVTDLGGSDTTYVDGERVEEVTRVQNGATLKCGKVRFKIDDIDRS